MSSGMVRPGAVLVLFVCVACSSAAKITKNVPTTAPHQSTVETSTTTTQSANLHSDSFKLEIFDTAPPTVTEQWSKSWGDDPIRAIAVNLDQVIVVSKKGVTALALLDGKQRWMYTFGKNIDTSGTITIGSTFLWIDVHVANAGEFRLRTTDGLFLHRFETGQTPSSEFTPGPPSDPAPWNFDRSGNNLIARSIPDNRDVWTIQCKKATVENLMPIVSKQQLATATACNDVGVLHIED